MICENKIGDEKGSRVCRAQNSPGRNAGNIVALHKRGTSAVRVEPGESVTARGRVGTIWVTMEGDEQDYAVRGGEFVRFAGSGLLVIEGLGEYNEAELRIERAC
jgi:hypothetical protein